MTKKWKHPDELPYNHNIGKRVKEMAGAGVPVKDIFAAIQSYQDAPGSLSTYYKLYRTDMDAARAANSEVIGSKVIEQAKHGDDESPNTWKAREFYLRSHGGWSPKTTEETREVGSEEEETETAVAALLKALGKDSDE